MECGFEQCLVDPCVCRLIVANYMVAIIGFHVDGIKIAATDEVTEVVVSALNQRFPTKHLGEIRMVPVSYTHLTLPTICSV